MSSKRIMWIDTAKAICIISIIMGHLNGRFPVFNTGLCVNNIVFAYHVPAFFILAGYTFKSEPVSKKYIDKKFRRLMGPFFMTCFFVMLMDAVNLCIIKQASINNITHFIAKDLIRSFFGSGSITNFGNIQMEGMIGAVWFLAALFFSLLLLQGIMNACSDAKKQYVVLGVLFLLAYIIKDTVWLPFSLLCAPTGALLIRIGIDLKNSRLLEKIRPVHVILLLIFVIWGIYSGYSDNYLVSDFFTDPGIGFAVALASSILIFLLAKAVSKSRYLSFIGKNSLLLLCIHLFDIDTMGYWWQQLAQAWNLSEWPLFFVRYAAYNLCLLFIIALSHAEAGRKAKHAVVAAEKPDAMAVNRHNAEIVCGILIISVLSGYYGVDGTYRTIIYSCHLAAFVFLAGYLFDESCTFNKQVKMLALKFLLPYVLYCIFDFLIISKGFAIGNKTALIQLLWKYLLGMSFSNVIFPGTGSVGQVYFFLLLFLCGVMYALISRLHQNDAVKAVIVVAISITGVYAGRAGYWLPWSADASMYCLVYFMAGHFAHKYGLLNRLTDCKISYFILSCISMWMIYKGGMEIAGRNYGDYTLVILGALAGTVLLWMLGDYLNSGVYIAFRGIAEVLSWIGKASAAIIVAYTLLNKRLSSFLAEQCGLNRSYIYFPFVSILLYAAVGIAVLKLIQLWMKAAKNNTPYRHPQKQQ